MRLSCLMSKFTASALAVALGAGVLVLPAPASAADDDAPLDTRILRGLLEGLGLRRDGEAINYQERAPLVIPPGRALPPPEKADAALANNPAWPKDPDVKRRRLQAEQERNRNLEEERLREQNPLRPDQMTPGGNPNTPPRRSASTGSSDPTASDRLTPAQLNAPKNIFSKIFGKDEPDVVRFTGEKPRTNLTEPPPGYQTPSPDQPYGVGKAVQKANDYKETHGLLEGTR